MPTEANKAADSIQAIKARRFSYSAIADYVKKNHGLKFSVSHICRVADGSRAASPELTKALVAAAKVMK